MIIHQSPTSRFRTRHQQSLSQFNHRLASPPINLFLTLLIAILLIPGTPTSADPNIPATPKFGTRLNLPGIPGTIIITGPKGALSAVDSFLQAAGGNSANIAIVAAENENEAADELTEKYRQRGADVIRITPSSDINPLQDLSGIWLLDPSPSLAPALHALLKRGGVLGASAEAAEWLGGKSITKTETLALLPGFIIDTQAPKPALINTTLQQNPGYVALNIPEAGALRIAGRRASVITPPVTTTLPTGAGKTAQSKTWRRNSTLDLVTLSRAAVARSGPVFPAAKPATPEVVKNGTLYIAGGGRPSRAAIERFIKAAGGADAKIVIIPTALGTGAARAGAGDVRLLQRYGARQLVIAHAATPEEAEKPAFLDLLRKAGGIWFSGGRQWRLVDSYLGTKAHQLMKDTLARGGAIAGSSAGASIQAEYMVRGHPLGNTVMMAEGYEHGLGFLPGVAIDQHFTQRQRHPDMVAVKKRFPQLIGIGLDESTAIFVTGHILEVVGEHQVSIYDRLESTKANERTILSAGDKYDLKERKKINP